MRRIAGTFTTIAAGALALAGCSGGSGEPSASPTPSAPPAAASATPSPTQEEHQIVSGADVAVLARLTSPTTGETWHAPVEVESLGLFSYSDDPADDDYRYLAIGTRGTAQIIVAVASYFEFFSSGYTPHALIEWDGSTATMVTCPSARASDRCLDYSTEWEGPGRVIDPTIHYDSLTYPTAVSPSPGWELQTAPLAQLGWVGPVHAYGDANDFPMIATSPDERAFLGRTGGFTTLAELGESRLVEYRQASSVPGLTDVRYGIVTPYGGLIPSESSFSGAAYGVGAVSWDDGADTFTHPDAYGDGDEAYGARSASLVCFGPDETLADGFEATKWQRAGTHVLGFPVYVPVAGGNSIAQAVYETMRDHSWNDQIDGIDLTYPYATYADFLDARSVFAWDRGDGTWVVAIDAFAANRVYECA